MDLNTKLLNVENGKMLALRDLLKEPVASVKERASTELERLIRDCGGNVVLFGAGSLGRRALSHLRQIGVEPLCMSDNNERRWGSSVDGCLLISPAQAALEFGSKALFVVTIWNAAHWYVETLAQLEALGCRFVVPYSSVYWRFGDSFLPFLLNDYPHKVFEDAERVLAAEALWADEDSLRTYRSHVYWYATGDASYLPSRPSENSYFPADIFAISAKESVVDCGAFDGDTIRQVIDRAGNGFQSVHAIEADTLSIQKLEAYIETLPPDQGKKIHVHPYAVGAERSTVHFELTGSVDSKICGEGGIEVECIPIDDLFTNTPVTMIKMDIEGAEYDALLGGATVIERDQPILAVCVYHTQNDIWRIPLLVREMLPHHQLFLRAYEGDGFQTVMYAVPPDRQISARA